MRVYIFREAQPRHPVSEKCILSLFLLTQEELADRAGLPPNDIGRIDRGESNVGVEALFKLARGLGVEPVALFER